MSVLSSERPHDQGVEHCMANNRWYDAAALQATQTIDNAGNGRQCQINSERELLQIRTPRRA